MRSSWRLLSCAVLLIFASTSCLAGAFLQPPGEGLVILTTSFAEANKAYDSKGRLIGAQGYDKFETRAYFEYGAFEQLTLVAESTYMRFHSASPSQRFDDLTILTEEARIGAPLILPGTSAVLYAGVGSGWLGARLRLFELGPTVLSLQASLRTATPSARTFLDMKSRIQEDARLQLALPIQLYGFAGFADVQLGYRTLGQNGGEIRADITCGVRPLESLLILAQSFAVVAPGDLGSTFTASQKFQLSAVYDLTQKISLQLGAIAAVRGANASAERGLVSAVWYRF